MEKNIYYLSLKRKPVNLIPVLLVLSTFIFIAIIFMNSGKKYLVYNHTDSIPKGFYYLNNDIDIESVKNGDLIVFDVPDQVKEMVIYRRWLNVNDTLTKPVSAKAGDFVCTNNRTVIVNNISYGPIEEYDSNGREMPWFKYCGTVKKGEVFVFIDNSKSFDSRYYGPIPAAELTAKATPLWIF